MKFNSTTIVVWFVSILDSTMLENIILWLLFVVGILLIACECWKSYLCSTKLKNFTVIRGLPILGNVLDLMKCDNVDVLHIFSELKKRHNVGDDVKNVIFWMGPSIYVLSDHPDTYELVLNSEKTIKKSYIYDFFHIKRGILTSEPNIWKKHRKLLNPTLGSKMVNRILPIINEQSHKMVESMQRHVGQSVEMYGIMFRTAIYSVSKSLFSVRWPMQNDLSDKLRECMVNILDRFETRIHSVWMHPDSVYRITKMHELDNQDHEVLNRIVHSIVESKKCDLAEKLEHGIDELADSNETSSCNFLEKCLQLGLEQKFDDSDIIDEVKTMFVTSTDTTSIIIHATTLMLAIHQDYQNQVFDELRSIFTNVDEPVTHEHLQQMQFLELVIEESLRLFPVAPHIAREATEDLQLENGIVPKGSQIILDIFTSNRSPKYWGENANEFYPERFLPENSSNFHPYQFKPFSAGPRDW